MTIGPAFAQPPATAILQPEGYLSTTPTAVLRQFGVDVALDVDTVAIGAPRATEPGSRGGRVYILTRIGPSWVQEAVLTPPPAQPGDPTALKFGYVLDISGDTLVTGSTGNALGYGGGSGVFVYRRGSSGWQLEATLRADDGFATAGFGLDVAIDGDTLLVGAPFSRSPLPGAPRGSAYVFTRTGTTWTKQAELRINDPAAPNLGFTVALDGDTALVGSPVGAGVAYVFTRTGGAWTEQARLAAPDARGGDQFAMNIALDGDTAVLGAVRAAGVEGLSEGATYVFTRTGAAWTFEAKLFANDAGTRLFGAAVAIDGDAVLTGCLGCSGPTGVSQGSAYLHLRRGGTWTQTQKIVDLFPSQFAGYGGSVALENGTAIITAPYADVETGLAHVLVDQPPQLPDFGRFTRLEDQGFEVVFGIFDPDSQSVLQDVTVTSSNQALLPDAALTIARQGNSRITVSAAFTPNAAGQTTLTITASDGIVRTTRTLQLIVLQQNDAPQITPIPDRTILAGASTDALPFTLSDVDHPLTAVSLLVSSSNTTLVPTDAIVLGGADAARTVTVTPTPRQTGTATITIYATDGAAMSSQSFTLTVDQPRTYYLAEGSTGEFFDLDILLANPNADQAPIEIAFLRPDGTSVIQTRTLPATSRTTIRVDEIPGLESASVSTIVTSILNRPIVVERTMRWDATGYGAHTEKATAGAATQWYFAEGAQGFFSTYFLLVNPHDTANAAHVTYYREGAPPIVRDYPLGPNARFTIDASADADLVDQAFGAQVVFDQPGVAERAMYFGAAPIWTGGHASAGATTPSPRWFLAEGATGSYFTTFVLLANPNDEDASVTLRYLPAAGGTSSGTPVTRTFTLPARQRATRNIAAEDDSLASAAVATEVDATRPIVVERAQYWPNPQWFEAHNSFGVTAAGTRWGLAEGRVGGAEGYQTYVLLANTGTSDAGVTLTFLRADGTTVAKTITVPAASRVNVAIAGAGSDVPELADESFGALIEATQPIVVERSMYGNANGTVWAAGTNATATPLP
jgi:hypothetical protein